MTDTATQPDPADAGPGANPGDEQAGDDLSWVENHFSPVNKAKLQDPYPAYAALRTRCPIAHSDALDVTFPEWAPEPYAGTTEEGFWVVSRYADVYRVARDAETFISSAGTLLPDLGIPRPLVPQEIDPPRHLKFRNLVSPVFSPPSVAKLEDTIRQIAVELLDSFIDEERVDIVARFTERLPTYAVWREPLLGRPIPFKVEGDFEETIAALVYDVNHVPERGEAASIEIRTYLERILADRRENPANDIPTSLVNAEIDGAPIDEIEQIDMLFLLFSAGIETTSSALASWLVHLARNPDLRARLIDEPELMPTAIEEFLRFLGPTQAEKRTVTCPVSIHGEDLDAGDSVMVLWGAANRDEDEFPDAHEFQPDRFPNRHLAFGAGIHRCIGSNLARLEARVALEELLKRFPNYQVPDIDDLEWEVGISRGLHHLNLELNR